MIPFLKKFLAAAKGRMFAPEDFTGNDLSYRIGRAVFRIGDSTKAQWRGIRRQWRCPTLAAERELFYQHVRARNWKDARQAAHTLANNAELAGDARLMEEIGKALISLGEYERAAELRLASRNIRQAKNSKNWQGETVDGLLLVDFVEKDDQGMGSTLKYAFMLRGIAGRARTCAAIVQPRLRALFARTFPELEVHACDEDDIEELRRRADKIARSYHLECYIGKCAQTIQSLYAPLKPDETVIEELRSAYRGTGKPLIGISWGSTAYAKDVPELGDWAALLKNADGQFVSLQYGKIESEIAFLQEQSGKTIIFDKTVDQIVDMDRFAAQIAVLDGVITISNTGAHLAGALNVPTIVLNDDNFRRAWPVDSDINPYCPATRAITKNGRPWTEVMDEAKARLQKTLLKRGFRL